MKNIRVLKPCSIDIEGVKNVVKVGQVFIVDDAKASKIIAAGFAEPVYTAEQVRATTKDFGERDPGGECWPWIKEQHTTLWRTHMTAFRNGDLVAAKQTYDAMLSAWDNHCTFKQPELLAA